MMKIDKLSLFLLIIAIWNFISMMIVVSYILIATIGVGCITFPFEQVIKIIVCIDCIIIGIFCILIAVASI